LLNIFENGFSCKAKPWQEFKRAFSQSSGPAGGARLSVELRGRTGMRAHTCGLWALLDWDEGPMRLCQLHGHQACPHAGPRASGNARAVTPPLLLSLFFSSQFMPGCLRQVGKPDQAATLQISYSTAMRLSALVIL